MQILEKLRHLVLFIERNLEDKVVYCFNFMFFSMVIAAKFYCRSRFLS